MLKINCFPFGVFFRKKFSYAEDCAEGLFYRLQLLSHDRVGLAIAEDEELTITTNLIESLVYNNIINTSFL